MSEFHESCYLCGAEICDGKPQCSHPEITDEAAQILMAIEFCDHYCCGMQPNECKATRLSEELARMKND